MERAKPLKNTFYIGIDPGKSGAIAYLNPDGGFMRLDDCPLIKGRLDMPTLSDWFLSWGESISKFSIAIESVHSMPKQGVVSTFTFGRDFGVYLGMIEAFRFDYQLITPQKWKKHFGLIGQPKTVAIEIALKLFPEAKSFLYLKKHHNRADAILLGRYLYETENLK